VREITDSGLIISGFSVSPNGNFGLLYGAEYNLTAGKPIWGVINMANGQISNSN